MGNIVVAIDYLIEIGFLVLGILICFAGYRFFRFTITVCGALIGYLAGGYVGGLLERTTSQVLPDTIHVGLSFVFAIALGVVSFAIYRKAVIYVVASTVGGAIYNAVMGMSIASTYQQKERLIVFAVSSIIGLALGIICFAIQKTAIIFFTGFSGAYLIGKTVTPILLRVSFVAKGAEFIVSKIFNSVTTSAGALNGLILLIFCIWGIVVQTRVNRGRT